MSLKKKNQIELSLLLNSIKLDKVTKFPISNTHNVPISHLNFEIVLKIDNNFFGFTIEEAIKESKHQTTVMILDKNGMHFYYTQDKIKQKIWIPAIYDTVKETKNTVVVLQNFPQDGSCQTKYIEANTIHDESIKKYLDLDVILFNDANFYIERRNLKDLAEICNTLWRQDILINKNGLTTLQNAY